jgi:hypothetical protein
MSVASFPPASGGGGAGAAVGTLIASGLAGPGNNKLVGPFPAGSYRIQFLGAATSVIVYTYTNSVLTLIKSFSAIDSNYELPLVLSNQVDGVAISSIGPTPVSIYSYLPLASGQFSSNGQSFSNNSGSGNYWSTTIASGLTKSVVFGNQSGNGANQYGFSFGGSTWTVGNLPVFFTNPLGLGYAMINNVGMFALTEQSTIFTLPENGVSLTSRGSNTGYPLKYAKWYGSQPPTRFVGVTGSVSFVSTDGITFNSYTSRPFSTFESPMFLNGTFYLCSGGSVQSSVDGITWSVHSTLPAGAPFNQSNLKLLHNGTVWLAIPQNSATYARSTDGITWTSQTAADNTTDNRGATAGPGQFIKAGYGTSIFGSADGITWTYRGSPRNYREGDYSGSVFIMAVDSTAQVQTSTVTNIS